MTKRMSDKAEAYAAAIILSLHAAGIHQHVVVSKDISRINELKRANIHILSRVTFVSFRLWQRLMLRWLIWRTKADIIQCWTRQDVAIVPPCKTVVIGWFSSYYDPKYFGRCDYLIGATKGLMAHMMRRGVIDKRSHFIPQFSTLTALPPINRGLLSTPKDARVLLMLSPLHPEKRPNTLLQALSHLSEAYIWFAGEGPLRQELENLARSLDLLERVRFLGHRSDPSALLRAADVCVLPSRHELFGTVILEAWSTGTPLVACRSLCAEAYIEDGVNGLLVPIDDPHKLAAALRRVLSDENLRRRLIAQGYATYIKNYTREAITQQWIQLYQHLKATP